MSTRSTALHAVRRALPPVTAILVVVALAATPAVAVTGTAGSVVDPDDDGTRIEQEQFDVHHGAFLDVSVTVPAGVEATVFLQRTTNAVTTRATVRDGGDGRIVLRLNTYTGAWSVRNATDSLVSQDVNPDRALRPDTYELTVDTPNDAARTSVTVHPSALSRLTTWRSPHPPDTFENASVIEDAIESRALVRATSVTENDTLVIQLDAPGLAGMIAAMPGENTTARFRHLFAARGNAVLLQTYPPPQQQRARVELLNETSVRVLAGNDTYYVLVDLDRVDVYRGDYRDDDFRFMDASFAVRLGLTANESVGETGERLVAFVDERRAMQAYGAAEPVELAPGADQRIQGRTTVGAGWPVTIVVRGTDDASTTQNESFVRRTTTIVHVANDDNQNAFNATLNLTGVPTGTDATVDVRFRNKSLLRDPIHARITDATTTTTNNTPTDDQTTDDQTNNTATATNSSTTSSTASSDENQTIVPTPAIGIPGTIFGVMASVVLLLVGRRR